MNMALSLVAQVAILIIVVTAIAQIIGKFLITDYQEDYEK